MFFHIFLMKYQELWKIDKFLKKKLVELSKAFESSFFKMVWWHIRRFHKFSFKIGQWTIGKFWRLLSCYFELAQLTLKGFQKFLFQVGLMVYREFPKYVLLNCPIGRLSNMFVWSWPIGRFQKLFFWMKKYWEI